MIINIRGGCGAGKSTLVRAVIDEFPRRNVQALDPLHGKQKPSGYILDGRILVPGHYQIQNGGLDTIGDLNAAYDLIAHHACQGCHVLYEGMNQKQDVPRVCELSQRFDVHAIVLNTPYDECLAAFRAKGQRRDERYVKQTHDKAARDSARLVNFGVKTLLLNRAEALAETRRLLCLT